MQKKLINGTPLERVRDGPFMTAKQKMRVIGAWRQFLESGLKREKFTIALYDHLTLHCSFIAHYDRAGFYSTYFNSGDDTVAFLSQFDQRNADENGFTNSVEYGATWWLKGDYEDINREMIQVATKYIPGLIEEAKAKQRNADILQATALLAKHGIQLT